MPGIQPHHMAAIYFARAKYTAVAEVRSIMRNYQKSKPTLSYWEQVLDALQQMLPEKE